MPTGANSVSNVTAGKPKIGGSIYRAPLGTDVPTDATTALDTAFKCLGYVSDEGVTNSTSIESEDIKAWGGDTVLTPQTGKTDNFQLALLESLNVEALKAYFGDENVTGTDIKTGLSVKCNSKELQPSIWVVEMIAAGNIPHRVVIPNAKPTEMEDITYVDNEPVALGMTLTALPDEDGNTHYEYFGGAETLAAKASAPAGETPPTDTDATANATEADTATPADDTEADTAAPAEQPTVLAAAEPAAAQASAEAPAAKTSRKASKKATKTAATADDA